MTRRDTDAPTVTERPGGSLAPSESADSARRSRLPTTVTAEDTLRQAEADRLQLAGRMFVPILLGAIAIVWFLVDGHPVLEWIYMGALLSWVVPFFWLIRVTASAERFSTASTMIPWTWVALIVAINQLYWGPFSAGIVVSAVFLTIVGPSHSLAPAVVSYIVTALGQLVPAIATTAGYPDLGVLSADHLEKPTLALLTVLLQAMLALCFAFGRLTRRTSLQHVAEQQQAMRQLGRREAVLAEARADFERALGRGAAGAFTEQILGSFRLGAVIGRGAMGEVYEATHVETGDDAAVKVLHRSLLANADTTRRFMREIEMASKISDSHVVLVLEVGGTAAPVPYIAMEKLNGESLADHMRRELRMSPRRARDLVHQISQGLAAAHALDIVHRDVKPQNLFLDHGASGDRWKVLDFGVGKLLGSGDSLTNDRLVGTPQYMAPEQASAKPVDARADVYGLAAVAYRVLTGHPPFNAEDLSVVVFQVVSQMPVRPRLLATLDQAIEDVLRIGMAKDPGDRFASVTELADALASAVNKTPAPTIHERAASLTADRPWRKPDPIS